MPERECWAYCDKNKHGMKDHTKKRGCGHSGRKKMSKSKRAVTINKIKSPHLSLAPRHINARAKGAQYISAFIPSLFRGCNNKHKQLFASLQCTYTGNGKGVKTISAQDLKEEDSKLGDTLEARLEMNGLHLKTRKAIDVYKNGKPVPTYTDTHTDLNRVLILVLQGTKIVWVAGEEPGGREKTFIDLAGNNWEKVKNDNAHSREWVMSNREQLTIDDDLGTILEGSGFRRCTLGPGDALLIPARFLHAVYTEGHSIGLSLTLRDD